MKSHLKKIKLFFKNFFKNKEGKIVIVQFPNTPLFIAIVLWCIPYFQIPMLTFLSSIFIFPVMLYWSYLEIVAGDSSFRKALGGFVAIHYLKNLLFFISQFN